MSLGPTSSDVKVDIGLFLNDDGIYDVEIGDDGDLKPCYGFETSMIMDLLCEQRGTEDEVIVPSQRRGWLGNENNDTPGYELGSKLWQRYQAKQTSEVRNDVVDKARLALSHMVPTYLNSVEVNGRLTEEGIVLEIVALRKTGEVDKLYFRLFELTGQGQPVE